MSSILAIAGLSIRAAIRSRSVITLLALLLAVLIGIPLTVKGDGTLAGQVRIMLSYSLGMASIVLGAFTLWTACMAIAQEVEGRQIHQIVTKPVHPAQIWLGKWIGLLALNAAFLAIVGGLTHVSVSAAVHAPNVPPGERDAVIREILCARRVLPPRTEAVDQDVRARIDRLRREGRMQAEEERLVADGKVPLNPKAADVFLALKKELQGAQSTVPVDGFRQWQFALPPRIALAAEDQSHPPLSVRIHLSTQFYARRPVQGTWTVGTSARPDLFTYRADRPLVGTHTFPVTVPLKEFGSGPLVVGFSNAGREASAVAVFDLDRNVEVLLQEGSFGANLFRSLAVTFCLLALLAALGLCAGTMFSFPVAVFFSASLLVMGLLVHYFTYTLKPEVIAYAHEHDDPGTTTDALDRLGGGLARTLSHVTEPVIQFGTFDSLTDGQRVSWSFTGKAAFLLVIVYSGVFAAVGTLALRRRELAMPD